MICEAVDSYARDVFESQDVHWSKDTADRDGHAVIEEWSAARDHLSHPIESTGVLVSYLIDHEGES